MPSLCYLARTALQTRQQRVQQTKVFEIFVCLSIDVIRCSIVFGSLIDPYFEDLNCRVRQVGPAPRHTVSEWRAGREFPYDETGIGFAGNKSGTVKAPSQELCNRLNIESAVSPMATVTSVVDEKRNDLVLERDVLSLRRRRRRVYRIVPFVTAARNDDRRHERCQARCNTQTTHDPFPHCVCELRFTPSRTQILLSLISFKRTTHFCARFHARDYAGGAL